LHLEIRGKRGPAEEEEARIQEAGRLIEAAIFSGKATMPYREKKDNQGKPEIDRRKS
jgi:hypothetical protein